MTVVTYKPIYTGNAYLVRSYVDTYDPATDSYTPYTGSGMVVSFAQNADGTSPLAGLQNLPMGSESPGVFHTIISPASLSGLPALLNQIIYQIVSGGPYNGVKAVTALKVQQPRWAQ